MFCGYTVETISHCVTESFLKKHHYLAQQGSGFLGKVQYGLFDKQLHLVGVIAFSGFSVWQTLIGAFEGFERYSNQDGFWELTRLAMDDERKEKNLTSWFVARAIRKLRKSYNVRAILSYADQIFSLDRPHPELRREGWEPLPDKARESTLQSQSGGEKWLR